MGKLNAGHISLAFAVLAFASTASAQEFSTSALSPSAVPASGVLAGKYPTGSTETAYYFAVDLKAGELATQISFLGRPNRDKKLEFDLLNAGGRSVGSHYILGTLDANNEQVRVLPVDAKGRYTIRLKLTGPQASLTTPSGLTYDRDSTDNVLPEIIRDTANPPALRQIMAPQCFVNIVTFTENTQPGYYIKFYWPENAGS